MAKVKGWPKILVDDRTGSKHLVPLLPKGRATLTRLEAADAAFLGKNPDGSGKSVMIGVEVKRLSDLLNSMGSGRLSGHQMVKMQELYHEIHLVVEGKWRVDPNTGLIMVWRMKKGGGQIVPLRIGKRTFTGSALYGYLNTLAVMCGVHVHEARDPNHTASIITFLHAWWQKETHSSHLKWQRGVDKAQLKAPSLVVRMTSELKGVGRDKAKAIAKMAKTPRGLLELTVEDLLTVDGIGKKTAEDLIKQLDG